MLAATSTIPRPNQLNIPVLEYADQVAATIALRRWTPWELKGFVDVCVLISECTIQRHRQFMFLTKNFLRDDRYYIEYCKGRLIQRELPVICSTHL